MPKKRSKTIQKRIENAVEIIEYAIKNQVSVKDASVKCGFSDTYVKNIKAMVYQKFNDGELNIGHYNMFNKPYTNYLNLKGVVEHPVIIPNNKISEPNKPRDLPKAGNRESFREKGNEAEYEWVGGSNYPDDHIRTLDQLLTATEVDTDIWKVKDCIVNKWDVTMKLLEGGELVPKTFQNFQVKARLERDLQFIKEKIVGEPFSERVHQLFFL